MHRGKLTVGLTMATVFAIGMSIWAGQAFCEVFWKKQGSPKIAASLTAVSNGRFMYDRVLLHGVPLEMEGVSVNLPLSAALGRAIGGMKIVEREKEYAVAVGAANGYASALIACQAGMNTFLFRVSALEKELAGGIPSEAAYILDDDRFPFQCRIFTGLDQARSWLGGLGAAMENGRISGNGVTGTYVESQDQVVLVFCRR